MRALASILALAVAGCSASLVRPMDAQIIKTHAAVVESLTRFDRRLTDLEAAAARTEANQQGIAGELKTTSDALTAVKDALEHSRECEPCTPTP